MILHGFFLLLLSLLTEAEEHPITNSYDSLTILYNGTISATYLGPGYPTNSCTPISLGPYSQTYFNFGVNEPWDPNPFFFRLDHEASNYEYGFYTSTYDDIWLLWILSAQYVWNDQSGRGDEAGRSCDSYCNYYASDNWTEPVQVWDLNMADIEPIDLQGEKGYRISGGPDIFLGKGIIHRLSVEVYPNDFYDYNQLDNMIEMGCIAKPAPGEVSESLTFNWTKSSDPTFDILITNEQANVVMTLNDSLYGFLNLSFTGTRLDFAYPGDQAVNGTVNQTFSGNPYNLTILLDTSNPHMPNFTFQNGSHFHYLVQESDCTSNSTDLLVFSDDVQRGNGTYCSNSSTTANSSTNDSSTLWEAGTSTWIGSGLWLGLVSMLMYYL